MQFEMQIYVKLEKRLQICHYKLLAVQVLHRLYLRILAVKWEAVVWQGQAGRGIALSGSCSNITREQVLFHSRANPTREIIAADVIEGRMTALDITDWLMDQQGLPLAYSSADPSVVSAVQELYGRDRSSTVIENFFADTAKLCL